MNLLGSCTSDRNIVLYDMRQSTALKKVIDMLLKMATCRELCWIPFHFDICIDSVLASHATVPAIYIPSYLIFASLPMRILPNSQHTSLAPSLSLTALCAICCAFLASLSSPWVSLYLSHSLPLQQQPIAGLLLASIFEVMLYSHIT